MDFEYTTDVDQSGVTGTTSASGSITASRLNPLLIDGETVSVTELESDGMSPVQGLDVGLASEPLED